MKKTILFSLLYLILTPIIGFTQNNLCKADFVSQPDRSLFSEYSFIFTNTTTGQYSECLWDFGDGTSSREDNPTHIYDAAGEYKITLNIYITDSSQHVIHIDSRTKTIEVKYNLGGHFFTGIYPATEPCRAILYNVTNPLNPIGVDTVSTTSQGFFLFLQIDAGKYLILAEPLPNTNLANSYSPTYTGDVLYWNEAYINIINSNNFELDIHAVPNAGITGGTGSIGGDILDNQGHPGNNVEVLLIKDSEILAFKRSDSQGRFSFNNIALGDYIIKAEIPGKFIYPVDITLTPDHPAANNIQVIFDNSNALDELHASDYNIYPNPATTSVNIVLNDHAANISDITLRNLCGRTVQHYTQSQATKHHTVNLTNLTPGFYLITLTTKEGQSVTKKILHQ